MPRIVFAAAAAVLAATSIATAQNANPNNTDSITVRVDRVFAAYDRPGTPGCALGVYRDGRMLYSRGYGLANITNGTPITPKTILDIGSTSKQFTAASVILLAQQGKLSLDDDVRRFIPELPRYQKPITIRHLLHHTSGLRDYIGLLTLGGADLAGRTTAKQALDAIVRQKALNFEPGAEHLYSNSGYFLLAQIVERASGKSMHAFAEENIFRPLGMTSTQFRDDYSQPLVGGAMAYAPSPTGFALDMSKGEQTGDGAVNTTVEDLLSWDNNFYNAKVGGPRLLEELHRTGTLDNGTSLTYAAGLTVSQFRGLRSVSHGGAWAGFRAELLRFPDEKFSVATLCNVGNSNPSVLARQVAEVYLADKLAPVAQASAPATASAARPVVTLTRSQMEEWVGKFLNPVSGASRTIAIEGEKLVATSGGTRFELTAHSPSEFTVVVGATTLQLRFERGPDGRRIRQWNGAQELPPFQEVTATGLVSAAYAGTYQSGELAASFTVTIADETIQVKLPAGNLVTLRQIRDGVFVSGGMTARFNSPRDGRSPGFELDLGRVRGIRFERTGT
ncbi:MAG TPA: serine hydrolase domain-containing protein [Gemmatimonadaceae bacterium]